MMQIDPTSRTSCLSLTQSTAGNQGDFSEVRDENAGLRRDCVGGGSGTGCMLVAELQTGNQPADWHGRKGVAGGMGCLAAAVLISQYRVQEAVA